MRPPCYPMRLFVCCALLAGNLHAEIATAPLTSQTWVAPNVVVTLDDSLSMNEECIPSALCTSNSGLVLGSVYRPLVHPSITAIPYKSSGSTATHPQFTGVLSYADDSLAIRQQRSSDFNSSYYNPKITYAKLDPLSGSYANVSDMSRVPFSPVTKIVSTTPGLDLSSGPISFTTNFCTAPADTSTCGIATQTFYPAQYYVLTPGRAGNSSDDFSQIIINNQNSFTKWPARSDCRTNTDTCTKAEELNNFAKWFIYWRLAGKFSADASMMFPTTYEDSRYASKQVRSPEVNAAYYNPKRLYTPWRKADGTYYPNSDPSKAKYDPNAPDSTADNLDLTKSLTRTEIFCTTTTIDGCTSSTQSFYVAQYWTYTPNDPNDPNDPDAGGTFDQTIIYKDPINKYPKNGSKDPARTDCTYYNNNSPFSNKCSGTEELQNFANWFTYYRNKLLAAKAAISQTFAVIPGEVRLGYGLLSITKSAANVVDGEQTGVLIKGVRPFNGTGRGDFYNWLLNLKANLTSTPLRRAMIEVGNYYMRKDDAGPWGETPGGASSAAHKICRRALHLLVTDGAWNDAKATALTGVKTGPGDQSVATGSLLDENVDGTYAAPFKDARSNTLADVAMYYWKTNLRSDLSGTVNPPQSEKDLGRDTNTPHMVNYTIGFGVGGSLSVNDTTGLKTGTTEWPDPTIIGADDAKIDDLWHASWNSGGQSFSAGDPAALNVALGKVIESMKEQSGSDAAPVSPSRFISADYVYVPTYLSKTWSGDLLAYRFNRSTGDRTRNDDGTYADAAWSAANKLDALANLDTRKIFTLNGAERFEFNYSNLNNKNLISTLTTDSTRAQDLIDYLRGDRTKEGGTAEKPYRTRGSRMGDVVNSAPALVLDGFDASYDFLPAPTFGSTRGNYRQFLVDKKKRKGLVFVGANDGMLHAFNATSGDEVFAFIPRTVLGDLSKLGVAPYTHRYFVDGPLVEADVYDKNVTSNANDKWRNIVVGTGGAGARNIFVINVPVSTTGNADTVYAPNASDILWEVNNNDSNFANLGYVLQKPAVGMMRDGTWVVIAGNGYVNSGGTANLYVINALTGAKIKTLTPTVTGTANNGLGGVRLVLDSQRRITAAYAGDLQGNLWKFDFSDINPNNWAVAFGGKPLFKAKYSATTNGTTTVQAQPITAAPGYLAHPQGGNLVVFGTGKLFEDSDSSDNKIQTLYAVWDKVANGESSAATTTRDGVEDSTIVSRSSLVTQTLATITNTNYFTATNTLVNYAEKRGWLIDLNMNPTGLRLLYEPQFAVGKVYLQTLAPNGGDDQCSQVAGKTVNVVVNAFTGSASSPTFDVNKDGKIDSLDAVLNSVAINAVAFSSADTSHAVFSQRVGAGVDTGVVTNAIGQKILVGTKNSLRRSWRQIIRRPSPAP